MLTPRWTKITDLASRAEVNDIYNTLGDGADGLVLAAETAIGQYPIQYASVLSKIIRISEINNDDDNNFTIHLMQLLSL